MFTENITKQPWTFGTSKRRQYLTKPVERMFLLKMIEVHLTHFLTEKDVPDAALSGKDSAVLKVPELKQWLQCHNAPTKGEKA